jgi:DNA polymerase-3 subunit alpha
MTPELQKWVENNFLNLEEINEYTYSIPDVGVFFLVSNEEGIVHKDMTFNLTDEMLIEISERQPDFLLFEFGGRFYYSKLAVVETEFQEQALKTYFNDFRYLGKAAVQVDHDHFVHLGIHTEYELLGASQSAPLYCKKAKFLGSKELGICDKDTLAGTLPFQFACEKEGLKPIFGETITVAYEYDPTKDNQVTYELKLYVKNNIGWRNLLRINKAINVDNEGFIPELELLE